MMISDVYIIAWSNWLVGIKYMCDNFLCFCWCIFKIVTWKTQT